MEKVKHVTKNYSSNNLRDIDSLNKKIIKRSLKEERSLSDINKCRSVIESKRKNFNKNSVLKRDLTKSPYNNNKGIIKKNKSNSKQKSISANKTIDNKTNNNKIVTKKPLKIKKECKNIIKSNNSIKSNKTNSNNSSTTKIKDNPLKLKNRIKTTKTLHNIVKKEKDNNNSSLNENKKLTVLQKSKKVKDNLFNIHILPNGNKLISYSNKSSPILLNNHGEYIKTINSILKCKSRLKNKCKKNVSFKKDKTLTQIKYFYKDKNYKP